MSKIIWL